MARFINLANKVGETALRLTHSVAFLSLACLATAAEITLPFLVLCIDHVYFIRVNCLLSLYLLCCLAACSDASNLAGSCPAPQRICIYLRQLPGAQLPEGYF